MSIERRKIMKAIGNNIVLTERVKGVTGAVVKVQEIVDEAPDTRIML
jgi:cysteine synthase A